MYHLDEGVLLVLGGETEKKGLKEQRAEEEKEKKVKEYLVYTRRNKELVNKLIKKFQEKS